MPAKNSGWKSAFSRSAREQTTTSTFQVGDRATKPSSIPFPEVVTTSAALQNRGPYHRCLSQPRGRSSRRHRGIQNRGPGHRQKTGPGRKAQNRAHPKKGDRGLPRRSQKTNSRPRNESSLGLTRRNFLHRGCQRDRSSETLALLPRRHQSDRHRVSGRRLEA